MKIGSIVELTQNHPTIESLRRSNMKVPLPSIPYILREIDIDISRNVQMIRLEEIINPVIKWKTGQICECGFEIKLFRELLAPEEQINVEELMNSLTLETI